MGYLKTIVVEIGQRHLGDLVKSFCYSVVQQFWNIDIFISYSPINFVVINKKKRLIGVTFWLTFLLHGQTLIFIVCNSFIYIFSFKNFQWCFFIFQKKIRILLFTRHNMLSKIILTFLLIITSAGSSPISVLIWISSIKCYFK